MSWPWKWAWALMIRNFWRRVRCIAQACLLKEGLAFLALMVSLAGAVVLGAMFYGNLVYFRAEKATDQLFYLSCGMLAIMAITFWSSHRLLGSKQAIEGEFWRLKFKLNQGDDEDEPEPGKPPLAGG